MPIKIFASEMQAWKDLLYACAAASDAIDRRLRQAGLLPLHWYRVLVELAAEPQGSLRMWELADRVALTRSGITRLADRITDAGLLVRQQSRQDRRAIFAVITPEGRTAVDRTLPTYAESIRKHFLSHLSREEVDVLATSLAKVRQAVRKPEGGAPR
ncbi:MAG: MarR family transcriptional regulator [Armatimonadetes bacterium]|nr:MarR family transcriptional regulator [Armatimonadota bacterium]